MHINQFTLWSQSMKCLRTWSMIKHGRSYVKVHPCSVMLESSEFQGKQSENYKEIDTSEETKSKQNNFEMNNSDQSDENVKQQQIT